MKKRSEAQIVGFLREVDAGAPVKDLPQARVLRSELPPLVQQVRRHECLMYQAAEGVRDRKGRLQKLLADSLLENEVTPEVLQKNGDHTVRREVVRPMVTRGLMSDTR